MPNYEVTSEIYSESNYKTGKTPSIKGHVVSEFPFAYPQELNGINHDEDGDLILKRSQKGVVQIEHSVSTGLALVGLQVWRGAFLLGDLALHWGHSGALKNSSVLELGAGTGLTSFVAAMYAKKVTCTDVDLGGIIDLIKINAKLNEALIKSKFLITSLDFTKEFTPEVKKELASVDIIFAADVIYDDTLTEAFVSIVEKLLNIPPHKKIIVALEKRYVFTLADMDSVAPCYETFLALIEKANSRNLKHNWKIQQLPIDFPQYFKYDRVKELILWELSSGVF